MSSLKISKTLTSKLMETHSLEQVYVNIRMPYLCSKFSHFQSQQQYNLLRCNCAENPLITTEQFWYAPWKENINKLRRFVGFKVVGVVKYFSEKCIERDVYPA